MRFLLLGCFGLTHGLTLSLYMYIHIYTHSCESAALRVYFLPPAARLSVSRLIDFGNRGIPARAAGLLYNGYRYHYYTLCLRSARARGIIVWRRFCSPLLPPLLPPPRRRAESHCFISKIVHLSLRDWIRPASGSERVSGWRLAREPRDAIGTVRYM